MSALADTLRALARVLDGQGVPWFVFGAQAVSVRGAPRATQDVDVTVDVERTRLRDLIRALESEGLRHRMKVLAGRGKDLDDLHSLLASGDVDLDEARDLLGQLERALGQSDLLPLLEQAIHELKG